MVNWSGNIGLILQVEEFTQKIASETLWMQKVELRTSQVSWKNQLVLILFHWTKLLLIWCLVIMEFDCNFNYELFGWCNLETLSMGSKAKIKGMALIWWIQLHWKYFSWVLVDVIFNVRIVIKMGFVINWSCLDIR